MHKSETWQSGVPPDPISGLYGGCDCQPPWLSGIMVMQKESKRLREGEHLVPSEPSSVFLNRLKRRSWRGEKCFK